MLTGKARYWWGAEPHYNQKGRSSRTLNGNDPPPDWKRHTCMMLKKKLTLRRELKCGDQFRMTWP
jgi:hypothetical protein